MFIVVDTTDRRPLYQQVVDEIKALIANRTLKEGDALPSVRQLAADLSVNLNTIAIAYRALQDEGLIIVKHGSGAIVSSNTTTTNDEVELRKSLRGALAQMVLAGLNLSQILRLVKAELQTLKSK
jgi:GntR family transcriptional regulator